MRKNYLKSWLVVMSTALCLGVAQADFESFIEAARAGSDDFIAQNYADARADYAEALLLAKTDIDKAAGFVAVGQIDIVEAKYLSARVNFDHVLQLDGLELPPNRLSALKMMQTIAQMSVGDSYNAEKKYSQARAEFAKVAAMPGVASSTVDTAQSS